MSEKAIKSRKTSQTAKGIDHGVDFQIGNERKGHKIGGYGGDAAENRKFERGNVALVGSKNFQHVMFNEIFNF